jgi:hypothetical protein
MEVMMLKVVCLALVMLLTLPAYAGPQVFKDTTHCYNCVDGWVKWDCECGDCENQHYYAECAYCGILRDNKIVVPFTQRLTTIHSIKEAHKEYRDRRLHGNDNLNPSGWLVPSFKK